MTEKTVNVAVVGATGLVGGTITSILEEQNFPVAAFYPVASVRSLGKQVSFRGQLLPVVDLAEFDFTQVDLAFFSAGKQVSRDFIPKATAAGCVVIDNSSAFRYDDDVPLVVPEVNPECIADHTQRRIIANPNCSTIQMVVALKPLHDAGTITRINVATYQAVSGSGNRGVAELDNQLACAARGEPVVADLFPQPIAFNVLPHIDVFEENGYTREEMKMVRETKKILGDDTIQVNPTTVRVPVRVGHSEAIHLETKIPLTVTDVQDLLAKAPGVVFLGRHRYPTAATHVAGKNEVYVGRVRRDISHPCGLNLWVVADNVRKGGAYNAVQIAQLWLMQYGHTLA